MVDQFLISMPLRLAWAKLWVGLALALFALGAVAEEQRISSAVIHRVDLLAPSSIGAAAAAQDAQVRLPDAWDARQSKRTGRWVYEMQFQASLATAQPYALFIPGGGNRLEIAVNGHVIGQAGRFDELSKDYSGRPHYHLIPQLALREGSNALRIEVAGESGRNAGLSVVNVGTVDSVLPHYERRRAWQTNGSMVLAWLALVLGALALGFSYFTVSPAFFTFGCAALLWSFRAANMLVTEPPLHYLAWSALVDAAYLGSITLICICALQALQLLRPWITRLGIGLAGASLLLIAIGHWGAVPAARKFWLFLMLCFAALLTWQVARQWWERSNFANRLLLAAALGGVALGAYDFFTIQMSGDGYGRLSLTRYALLLFILAMAVILMRRFGQALRIANRSRGRLHRQLARARTELQVAHAQSEQAHVREAVLDERQRIMRDMHDGLGAQLADMLGLLRRPGTSASALERHLRESIDELRTTIDAMESLDGDLGAVLGALRARLERRLDGHGIELIWNVQPLPGLSYLTPSGVQHVLRIVIEAFTNVLKHSKARSVTVAACADEKSVLLSVTDDGVGLDSAHSGRGHGIGNMHSRAHSIGAELTVRAIVGGGTEVRLSLPIALNS